MTQDTRLRFFVTEKLGPKMSKTPEGFLLCEGVPLARTGEMHYGPGETPIPTGPEGYVRIVRDAGEVFRPEFMASLTGKPVTDEHPDDDVTPVNWNTLSRGIVLNPRRGEGAQDDLLIGDVLICHPEAIEDVLSGKREVSVGYDAEYDETGPGLGRQYNMIANHVALVEAGRCGPRCAIHDRKTVTVKSKTGDCSMKTKDKKVSWMDRLMAAVKTKDEGQIEEAVSEVAQEATDMASENEEIHIHAPAQDTAAYDAMNERIGNLESNVGQMRDMMSQIGEKIGVTFGAQDATPDDKDDGKDDDKGGEAARANDAAMKDEKELGDRLEEEAPADAPKEKVRKAKDSQYLGEAFQEAVSGAEILVPGMKAPEFIQATEPKKTLDSLCEFRRSVLDAAYKTEDGKAIIEGLNGGKAPDLPKMVCRDVRTMFRGAVGIKKTMNNSSARVTDIDAGATSAGVPVGAITSVTDLNEKYRKHYGLSQ